MPRLCHQGTFIRFTITKKNIIFYKYVKTNSNAPKVKFMTAKLHSLITIHEDAVDNEQRPSSKCKYLKHVQVPKTER